METHVVPGARFVDPKVLARIKDLELLARSVVDGFINGLHRAPYFGASIDFAEHRGYVPGDDIRRVDWRLYARTDRYFVKQYEADTNANFSRPARHLEVDGRSPARACQARVREVPGGVPGVSLAPAARPRRHHDVRRGRRDARAAVGEALQRAAAHARSGEARSGRAGCCAMLDKIAEHFKRRSIVALISDLYENPDELLEALKPYRFRRQRPRRVSRARSGRDRLSVPRPVAIPGSRERRGGAGRARGVRRAVSEDDARAHRGASLEVLGVAHRLRAAQYLEAARRGAVQLSRQSRAADAGAVNVMSFLAPLFFVGAGGHRGADLRPPDPARAEGHRRVPVADVHPAGFRISRWSAGGSTTGRCCCCASPRMALVIAAFSRPFFTTDPSTAAAASAGAREVVILLDRSASMGYGDHWTRAQDEARSVVNGLGGEDRGDARAVRPRRRRGRARDDESRRARAGRSRQAAVSSEATRYAPALAGRAEPAEPVRPPRKEAYLISDFQKTGWERQEEIQLPRGRGAHARVGGRPRHRQPGGDVASRFSARSFSSEERVTITAGLTNRSAHRGDEPAGAARDRRPAVAHARCDDRAERSGSVTFDPVTVAEANMRGDHSRRHRRAGAATTTSISCSRRAGPCRCCSCRPTARPADAQFLTTALGRSKTPPFKVDVVPASRFTAASFEGRSVVVLNDAALSTADGRSAHEVRRTGRRPVHRPREPHAGQRRRGR